MELYRKHAVKTLSDVIGHDSTVTKIKRLISRPDYTGGALYLSGPSGCGKTSIATALCEHLKAVSMDVTSIGGTECSVDFVRDTERWMHMGAWGADGWKILIVNEAQNIQPRALQVLLPIMGHDSIEPLPDKRLFIFTSTSHLEEDLYGDAQGPFASRCQVFKLKPDWERFALHLAKIASAENLNGRPVEAYQNLIKRCKNNMRMAYQKIEAGEMLEAWTGGKE